MKLDFLNIGHLFEPGMVVNKFPMTDRDPLPRWTHGRVTLLGDAAHPMYPSGANGASQAIVDARALVLCFREHGVTCEGLQAYDDLRRPMTNKVVLASPQYGLQEILKIVDERCPDGFNELSEIISTTEIETLLMKFKQLTGSDIEKLNQESPLF